MGCTASNAVMDVPVKLKSKESETTLPDVRPSETHKKAWFHTRYLLGRKLGKGAFSKVYLAEQHGQGEKIAVKITDMRSQCHGVVVPEIDHKAYKAVVKEIDILYMLEPHENLIKIFDSYIEEPYSYIAMELCRFTLLHTLERQPELNEHTYAPIFRQMVQALVAIQKKCIAHRDIKPDNFLCSMDYNKEYIVKLCDFGLAEVVPPRTKLGGVYGTAPFMSPEMLAKEGYDEKIDLWSLGALCYVLMLGQFPYMPAEGGQKTAKAMKAAILVGTPLPSFEAKAGHIKLLTRPSSGASGAKSMSMPESENSIVSPSPSRSGNLLDLKPRTPDLKPRTPSPTAGLEKRPPSQGTITSSCKGFLRVLLDRDPSHRPTAEMALQHPWLSPAFIPGSEQPPSLRSLLHAAKRVGAFDIRNGLSGNEPDSMDEAMDKFQAQARAGRHAQSTPKSSSSMHHPMHLPNATELTLTMASKPHRGRGETDKCGNHSAAPSDVSTAVGASELSRPESALG